MLPSRQDFFFLVLALLVALGFARHAPGATWDECRKGLGRGEDPYIPLTREEKSELAHGSPRSTLHFSVDAPFWFEIDRSEDDDFSETENHRMFHYPQGGNRNYHLNLLKLFKRTEFFIFTLSGERNTTQGPWYLIRVFQDGNEKAIVLSSQQMDTDPEWSFFRKYLDEHYFQ